MVLLIFLWIAIIYEVIKLFVRLFRGGSKTALVVFDILWFLLFAYLGATANCIGVAMGICLFVGVPITMIIGSSESRMKDPVERQKMINEVKAQDEYDNDYGIYDPKKK